MGPGGGEAGSEVRASMGLADNGLLRGTVAKMVRQGVEQRHCAGGMVVSAG